MRKNVEFSILKGEKINKIEGMEKGSELIKIYLDNGRFFEMYHEQDCCEEVEIEDVCGDAQDILGLEILEAREEVKECAATFTFYHLTTIKGSVVIRWCGLSNGYYSESVDFIEILDAED